MGRSKGCVFLRRFGLNSGMVISARSENGYGFQRCGLKKAVEDDTFWSEIGSGFGEAGCTPLPGILRSTPFPGNLGGNWALIYVRFYNVVYQNDYYLETW